MELIKIIESNGTQAVSARELHTFLQAGSNVNTWFKNQADRAMLVENVDYVCIQISESEGRGGQNKIDYAISINSAKEIAMLNGGDKGKQARKYFIECEKQLKKPMTQIELILKSAQILADIEKKQTALESRIEAIEKRPAINAPIEHFSVMGYCYSKGLKISLDEAKSYSLKCKKMCVDLGMTIGKVPDARYGAVNTYPSDVLCQIIGK